MKRRWQAWKIDCRDFVDARRHALLSVDQVAELLHVHPKTVSKWERGLHRIPYPAYKLLRVLRRYELPEACWDGWEARSGALWSPAGQRFTPGDLAWLSLTFRRAEAFTEVRRQLQALRSATRQQVALATSSVVILQGPAPEGPHKRPAQGDPLEEWGGAGVGVVGHSGSRHPVPFEPPPSAPLRSPSKDRGCDASTEKEGERECCNPARSKATQMGCQDTRTASPHERAFEKTERAAIERRERISPSAPDAATLHSDTGEDT